MRFFKYTGLGNDFLIFDQPPFDSQEIKKLCHRQFGIGADGILFVTTQKPFIFSIYNCDGKRAKLCGNGLRCYCQYLLDLNLVNTDAFEVKSDVGVHYCKKVEDEIAIQFQMPTVLQQDPMLIDCGIRHLILNETPDLTKAKKLRFQYDANVNFVFQEKNAVFVKTFEKGVEDFTLACGTGAMSTFFTLNVEEKRLFFPSDDHDPQSIYFSKNKEGILMQAKAWQVFEGRVKSHVTC